ncbi:phosphoserine phosphatase SerB [Acinetobacter sp. MD2(2019)]|uniref:phosphoserine phosphatase SerB n=1 Tax=Acinetobacter sp. MD2(2019) TaxID=2605273 RepID=UPI002D1F275A|nr:phosphoserine phosphatase SerB [Acinetobacter sp. MD2(2019)]MEB3754908.1 phosphoserine phosphatase SerB [Acinetobacter sp. MD2(2019)]
MREITLISFLGPDQPNVLNRLVQVLSGHSLQILDIRQAVMHQQLSLSLVTASSDAAKAALAMKELLILAQEIDLTVRLKPICNVEYEQDLNPQDESRYIVSAFAPELTTSHLHALTQAISEHGLNIVSTTPLSTALVEKKRACVAFDVCGEITDLPQLRHDFLTLADRLKIDITVQNKALYGRSRGLICFDMDSTLIGQEVIDELAKEAGVGAQVAEITERAMQGELDFQQSFRARVALLKGLDASVLPQIAERLTINDGAQRLISSLKALGYHTAIFSGGFQYFAQYLQQKLGIDEVHANVLDVQNGKVTGEVAGQIVDAARKAELLQNLADQRGLSLAQTVAVGDGANDLPMLAKAGVGVAFKAKPLVRQTADYAISSIGLDGVLYILGLNDQDIAALQVG